MEEAYRPTEESLENNGEYQTPDFQSLEKVEFAGRTTETEPSEQEEDKEKTDELTLEEKVAALRAPFEADEALRVAHVDKVGEIQIGVDARKEELEQIQATREELMKKQVDATASVNAHMGKVSTRILGKIGIRTKKTLELAKARAVIQSQIYELDAREGEIDEKDREAKMQFDEIAREPEYEVNPEPLTVEQKEKLLTPEALSELSLEEYLALWRRLNPFYASHVTRQGVRDHNSMFYHSAGMGKFSHGFTEMLETGKCLHAASEVYYGLPPVGFTEDDVRRTLEISVEERGKSIDEELAKGKSIEEVADHCVRVLPMNSTWASAEPWSDVTAIHVGRNTVLNETYGAEKGNETFYVFPIDVIASQHRFGGHVGGGFDTAQVNSERKWNDTFVWSENGRISLDSGIVFLPKSAEVSPETGSVYETVESIGPNGDKIREPFLDEAVVQSVTRAIETLEKDGCFSEYGTISYDLIDSRDKCEALLARLKDEFGLEEELAQKLFDKKDDLLVNRTRLADDSLLKQRAESDGFIIDDMDEEESFRILLRYSLESRCFGFKKAENPISSEAYWQQYFEQHPEQRPKHLVFYDGDPSDAVDKLMLDHHIATRVRSGKSRSDISPNAEGPGDTHEKDGQWLGFEKNLVRDAEKDELMCREHARFNEIAHRLAPEIVAERAKKMNSKTTQDMSETPENVS